MKLQVVTPITKVVTSSNGHSNAQSLVPFEAHEACVSNQIHHIVVPNNLLNKHIHSATGADIVSVFPINPFQHVQIRAKRSKKKDIVLEDTVTNEPIAVCRMMFNGLKPCKIYTTTPNYAGQKASKQKYSRNSQDGGSAVELYTFAEIMISNNNRSNRIVKLILTRPMIDRIDDLSRKDRRTYIVSSLGNWSRVVIVNGKQVALMETKGTSVVEDDTTAGKSSSDRYSSCTHLTVSPGIDPCLMICLSAICSHFDEISIRE
jgi:hypothetical protein